MKNVQKGVTLMELVVVAAIIAVVSAIAIPGFKYYIQNTRAITLANTFTTTLAYARSESVTRGKPVSVCAAADSSGTTCGDSGDWANGWIIFLDADSNGVVASGTDQVVRVQQSLGAGVTVTTTSSRITYDTTGYVIAGAGDYTLSANGCTGDNGRKVTLSNTGTPTVTYVPCD